MTAATTPASLSKRATSEGESFIASLPIYRLAMQFAAVNMADLNFPGSLRTQAMDWWVSDDEGIAQLGQVSEFIGRFHEELMRLPEDEGSGRSIGSMSVLTNEAGQHTKISDLTSRDDVRAFMQMSAGIREGGDGGHLLCDAPGDRKARAVSASMIKETCEEVCAHVRQRFAPDEKAPDLPAGVRPPASRSLTPSL